MKLIDLLKVADEECNLEIVTIGPDCETTLFCGKAKEMPFSFYKKIDKLETAKLTDCEDGTAGLRIEVLLK